MSLDVLLVHAGAGQRGGVSVDVDNLCTGLRRRGHRVAVAGSLPAVAKALRERAPVVHVFGCLPSATTFGAMAAARRARRPLVWTPIFHPSRVRSWVGYGPLRVMEAFDRLAPRAARFVDAVLAATEAEAEHFRRLKAPRVDVIPPGVWDLPEPAEAAQLEAFRRRLELHRGPVLLTVARDNSRKGLPFGLAAFTELHRRRPDVQLLLAGPDLDHPSGALRGVRLTGWLGPEEIELAYQVSDVLFVPSLYEGLPRAVVEAWRFGLPVVATDRVALAPTIDRAAGRVVPYGDVRTTALTLLEVVEDDRARQRFSERARAIVAEQFLLDGIVDGTVSCYERLRR